MNTTIETEVYDKEEVIKILTEWIPDDAKIEASWPFRSESQIALLLVEEDEGGD